ncbi:hypothetical protein E4631_20115 [Hymenobacter sp. UV11]|uniref:hypothetical protein n=1 Tax=Hymenobacter sp. UV11 TaxID=1849735 RepID=UPI0010605B98|nr:hypothetical protein [Hymenobacter sp. UV11]TDN36935.1 hypothetical protein A8B98_05950 [Hymenobacter sp. UV11]TFZ64306.1 hypothetical protein E4631_20115 [Hymenobacter sp. UV11]
MTIKQLQHLLRRLTTRAAKPATADIEASWQQLTIRFDQLQLPGQSGSDLARHCIDRPGPHGALSKEAIRAPAV